jgi:tRNA modification GTPase
VVRLSGADAGRALEALAGDLPPPRSARRRRLCDPGSGAALDDALVLWFPGPASYTGEDVAELHLHGSRAVLAAVAGVLGGLGLRLAEPGEFTRRAFQNGKLDLTQAEAIADLAVAETEAQRRQALRQLDGELGDLYRGWSGRLVRTLAYLEAAIDFPDEDLPPEIDERIAEDIRGLAAEIAAHLVDSRRGERLRDGIAVAIVGRPNAGKSSLLNRIARREAAITSPLPGTTRDIVEVAIDLRGYPVILADTAGLREAADPVEAEGLRRAHHRAAAADIRLYVFDAANPGDAAGAKAWPGADTFLVANKIDLFGPDRSRWNIPNPVTPGFEPDIHTIATGAAEQSKTVDAREPSPACAGWQGRGNADTVFPVSALTGEGLHRLLDSLARHIAEIYRIETPVLTRARHREALEEALAALERSLAAEFPELRAEDLRLGQRALGRITGALGVEDLLDIIFRDFCIGK